MLYLLPFIGFTGERHRKKNHLKQKHLARVLVVVSVVADSSFFATPISNLDEKIRMLCLRILATLECDSMTSKYSMSVVSLDG